MFWRRNPKNTGDKSSNPQKSSAGADTEDVEKNIGLAQKFLTAGDLPHALSHAVWALKDDSANPNGRAVLDQIISATPKPLDLIPTPNRTTPTPFPMVAARAYICAGQGNFAIALQLMGEIYKAIPDFPYLGWVVEWLSIPAHIDLVDPGILAALVATLAKQFDKGGSAEARKRAAPIPTYIAHYVADHPQETGVSNVNIMLAGKLHQADNALNYAQAAYQAMPDARTALGLALSHGYKGNRQAQMDAYRLVLTYDPHDIAALLTLGDKLCEDGQLEEGLTMYQGVLDIEPEHVWAKPSALYFKALLEPNETWQAALKNYVAQNPSNGRARELLGRLSPFVASLPEPGDATLQLLRHIVQSKATVKSFQMGLSSLESPSSRRALELHQIELYGVADLTINVARIQKPDPRIPREPVDFVLWRYKGNEPQPAVGDPTPQVAEGVGQLAARPYNAFEWWGYARTFMATSGITGINNLNNLLGTMIYPPPRPADVPIWVWLNQVQVAAAFLIGHIDGGWNGSRRKRALLSLARGPMDWSVQAAVLAHAQIGREDAEAVPDIAALYIELLNNFPRPGGVPYEDALAACASSLSNVPKSIQADLVRALKRAGHS